MTEFLQQLLNGVLLGAIYALIALGYTMVYGVLRFINFAHSDVFMLGAFVAWYSVEKLGLPTQSIGGGLAALLLSMSVCAVLVLITAIGVSLLIQNVAQNSRIGFGPNPKAFPALFPSQQLHFGALTVSTHQLVVLGVALSLLGLLYWIVHHTRIGTAMRAVSFNATAASLVGINNDRIISFTFGLGSALAGAGGVLYAMNYPSIDPLMGTLPGLKAFVAAVLGGIGNLPGAALGGLLIGLVETFVSGTRLSTFRDAIAFGILIAILLFRPAGLLGKLKVEKV
jgi:branched-chain amino acid transport system permease protein